MADEVLVRREGAVAVITLNRPEARNAMNYALARAGCDAIAECQDAGAIVLTGADPAFCAGLDLRNLGVEKLRDLPRLAATVAASGVPVIGAVNGPAVTGGFEVALACDFLIGSERAAFADTHVRVGVFPGPVLLDLPRRVGMARAREMSLTGNFVRAEEAWRIGIVNHLVPHEELVPRAIAMARDIAESDRDLVRRIREGHRATEEVTLRDAREVHQRFGAEGAGTGRVGADIAARRETVLARSKVQRAE